MDLEDLTMELSRPVEALDVLNRIFENELSENYDMLIKPELKKFFDILYAYNYITRLLAVNLL